LSAVKTQEEEHPDDMPDLLKSFNGEKKA